MSIGSLISNDTVTKDGVVYLASHSNFAYSDGDRAERYVRDVIHGATDVSSDSPELVKYIRDWPSRYHLSRERAHAYRSLAIPADATVLEIGCGCGSITRLLGEKAARVLALEGSARRASITRDRTRDLENVTVLCASFEEVAFQSDFDIVICNGVLEYAALFVRHARPHQRMIELLARLVRPGGSLIVAIENKMGLRYFASGREEHTNVRFDGLEGYAAFPSGPRTFGALELRHLLAEKFTSVETLLPLPDYKLPIALIRAELLDRANCAELFANTAKHDYDTVERPLMHERLVWRELANNGLLRDFANSLFLIAGTKSTMLLDRDWMGDIYSTSRTRDLAVRTTIRLAADGAIVTEKGYLYESVGRRAVDPLRHTLQMSAWSEGPSIHTCVTRALMARSNEPIAARLRWPVELWWRVACGDAPEPTSLTGSRHEIEQIAAKSKTEPSEMPLVAVSVPLVWLRVAFAELITRRSTVTFVLRVTV